ncbi:MAG: 16S rRNA (guanine(527)-N(7))-methyltransferase RsmG [Rivihabitans pingtungensis]|jgi:16S rRNA (guanine527-N7)-methyltransferase|uniref:16S rRNA (guanine(527)-N(7))-methyltransferase RsmG n=1 Tax=Rivihabitans pingtungensis TaxID=1054498 RepID=UPI0023525890|nr:16S rRNA (guanine(527)-N(7))-methyltransferase RsmG [Rivihabitans pingtungensis]MCK6438370.1 16S rRNA (guanine(527)-N(7))-methyltransferase RsmG [Rivihabitans pingtungensis]HNX70182.1 16S rRNA (guanine(527)-N(7))-methyltransferase RsmG [Rivihabitans pingtungensis]
MTLEQELEAGLAQLGLELSAEQIDRLNQYLALLNKWNKTYNLTAVRETERMVAYHVLDSLSALPHIQGVRVLDVGSGGGMPGMLFAIARPDWQLTLIDANHKKTTFLRQAAIELGLNNVEVHCERVEALAAPAFDVITSRAFADLAEFVRLTRHVLADGGVWAALKGVYPYEEIAQLPDDIRVVSVQALHVPGLDAERHLVTLARV